MNGAGPAPDWAQTTSAPSLTGTVTITTDTDVCTCKRCPCCGKRIPAPNAGPHQPQWSVPATPDYGTYTTVGAPNTCTAPGVCS